MDDQLAARLLGAINQTPSRLAILFGAGLSVDGESNVPLANELLSICVREYEKRTGATVQEANRNSLGKFASYLYGRDELRSLFIRELVPWDRFRGNANQGHEAIVDFLICQALEFAVTTNVDTLVEDASGQLGRTNFVAALDGDEAGGQTLSYHRPLLKIHGCCNRCPPDTIWCSDQLSEARISRRIERSRSWLEGNLPHKDIVVILGFWTDWKYLNALFGQCVKNLRSPEGTLFVVVNPASEEELREGAPELFALCDGTGNIDFLHVPASGSEFLAELRERFSRQVVRWCAGDGTDPELPDDLNNRELYVIRQQLFGFGPDEVVREKARARGTEWVIAFEKWLVDQGAVRQGAVFEIGGKTVRVVNSAGQSISQTAAKYRDNGSLGVDVTVCVGAVSDYHLRDFARPTAETTVARSYDDSRWLSDEDARERIEEETA